MAFLDTFSEERKYPGCHCTKHICPGTSKVSLKIPSKQLSKVTKKCKKLYRRNVSMHQPLKSRDLLCELAEEILDLKFGQRWRNFAIGWRHADLRIKRYSYFDVSLLAKYALTKNKHLLKEFPVYTYYLIFKSNYRTGEPCHTPISSYILISKNRNNVITDN